MVRLLRRFQIDKDFSKEDYNKWLNQLQWWISTTMKNIDDPKDRAKKVLLAAMNGTKLDGSPWPGISDDFFKRVNQLAGFDLKRGVGLRRAKSISKVDAKKSGPRIKKEDLPPMDIKEFIDAKLKYVEDLLEKYPHLENEVYAPKVDELAETIIKSRMLSQDFMAANVTSLDKLNKIRESLHKQIKELMEFLEISPKFLMQRQKESDTADVGSLIAKLESYGEIWQEYERLDSLRELIQKYHQLNSARPDGTPQLNDWELWHMTRTKPIQFECRCGEKYTLLDGFTPEEIEKALEQAYEVYGFGLEPIGETEDPEAIEIIEMMDETPIPQDLDETEEDED